MTRHAIALALATVVVVAASARADAPRWTLPQTVMVGVGQSAPIYAKRTNDCGAPAPSFSEIKDRLPKTALGTYFRCGHRAARERQPNAGQARGLGRGARHHLQGHVSANVN